MSWEHIINDASIITRENICLCCRSCNASKGQKKLSVWLQSNYYKERSITLETLSTIIKRAIVSSMTKYCGQINFLQSSVQKGF